MKKKEKYNIAIVGATGNVGREIISMLAERHFPSDSVYALASQESLGMQITFGTEVLNVDALDDFDFSKIDIAFFSAGGTISEKFVPIATKAGCYVIDNTSFFRMRNDVPLIVPEVNPSTIQMAHQSKIIANPNCSTAQMLLPLKPLHDVFKIKRIVVSTYQSVSGKGKAAMDELYHQTKKLFEASTLPPKEFEKPIAFNCIPKIDQFLKDGNTKEEWKIIVETQKILDPSIQVSATCVRVPVFNCHAESVNVEFHEEFDLEDIFRVLEDAPGVTTNEEADSPNFMTQIDCSKLDPVFVSRVRRDESVQNGLNMWIVADNLRKGAALNAVQIAELLVNGGTNEA